VTENVAAVTSMSSPMRVIIAMGAPFLRSRLLQLKTCKDCALIKLGFLRAGWDASGVTSKRERMPPLDPNDK
jgi:hypothetical protein